MTRVTTILSDVGGVLGTNGWDRPTREKAARTFQIDWIEFEDRHELVVNAFELAKLDIEEYLNRTVFYRARPFTREQFRDFMFAQSQSFPESLELFARLAGSKRYLLAILNNESAELNRYRIEHFGLRKIFAVFFSSCFLGVKKPDAAIYELVLKLSQRVPAECLFIDDRSLNVECASRCGIETIQYKNARQLEEQMRQLGVEF